MFHYSRKNRSLH